MIAAHLAKLNPEQRRAVEYGGPALAEAGPLLIIAGAGTGKTNTLAHRVGHLIASGIDPRRIMAKEAVVTGMIFWNLDGDQLARAHRALFAQFESGACAPTS